MMIDEQRILQKVQPLMKIIKQRESIFFDLLNFANKNIESSSNEIDQITIFTKYISNITEIDIQKIQQQCQFLKQLSIDNQEQKKILQISNSSKQMIRLYNRVIEIIQSSIEKARTSLFNSNGKLSIDFANFKKNLIRIMQRNPVQMNQFVKAIVLFCQNKFKKQFVRIKNYLQKLKDGEHVSLRDMYSYVASDGSSPDQKHKKKQFDIISKEQSQNLQQLLTKNLGASKRPQQASKIKRNSTTKASKKQKQQVSPTKYKQKQQNNLSKSVTANLLLKFYSVMQLNKKQFLQDYLFQKNQQQQQKKRLMTQLVERNKLNSEQISQYVIKCQAFNQNNKIPSLIVNSDDNRNDSSLNSKVSIKTSFLISKRKPSFTFQSVSDRSDAELTKNQNNIIVKTIKNLSKKKRNSLQKPPKQASKGKKIFVAKSPFNFDDDIIPKAQITQAGWAHAPLTGKQRNRKNQSLRLKKRNNPFPFDEKNQGQTFRFTQNPY